MLGIGVWHTSILVDDPMSFEPEEYAFYCDVGVKRHMATIHEDDPYITLKKDMYITTMNENQLQACMKRAKRSFGPNTYHLLHHNCQTYCIAVLRQLGFSNVIPKKYIRIAAVLRPFFPRKRKAVDIDCSW